MMSRVQYSLLDSEDLSFSPEVRDNRQTNYIHPTDGSPSYHRLSTQSDAEEGNSTGTGAGSDQCDELFSASGSVNSRHHRSTDRDHPG